VPPAPGQLFDLTATQRYQRHLSSREHTADNDEQESQDAIEDGLIHGLTAPYSAAGNEHATLLGKYQVRCVAADEIAFKGSAGNKAIKLVDVFGAIISWVTGAT